MTITGGDLVSPAPSAAQDVAVHAPRKAILLIANYAADRQHSMLLYANWLTGAARSLGFDVHRVEPRQYFGSFFRKSKALNKWLAYVDKFIVFPVKLMTIVRRYDVVHIVDHGNAQYQAFVRGVPTVVTCHDLLAVRSSLGETELSVSASGRVFQKWILNSLKKIKYVCCVSRATSDDFSRLAGSCGHYVQIIPMVLNYPFAPMPPEAARLVLANAGIQVVRPFLLHVGGNNWYKNRAGVADLFGELCKMESFKGFTLVMAGAALPHSLEQRINAPDLAGNVRAIISPSSEVLRALYSTAEALLFPSLQEGFGWPVLEAQACGCPVITSDREPMKTVGGTAAFFIDPADPSKSAIAIEQNWQWIRAQREASIKNLERYSQDSARAQYLKLYQAALQNVGDAHVE